jgi:TRAP-type C4-dicarboxylate transport system permease small subunit
MRRLLDATFDAAAYLAASLLVGTLAMVLTGIAGRLFAFHIAGTDAYAGYCTAGCGFLALAHTLKRGEHIRVTLILARLSAAPRHALELVSLAIGTLLAGLLAYYSTRLAFDSWQFNDVSTASDATPLWIPQLAMAAGAIVLALAFADELVLEWQRRRRRLPAEAIAHHE